MFTGAMVALITPFQDGEIDFETRSWKESFVPSVDTRR